MTRWIWIGLALGITTTTQAEEVVGGQVAAKGAWDDAAAIYYGWSVNCTGTLIAPDVVLTAGHCIGGITGVKLQTNDYAGWDGEYIDVVKEIEYPNSWYTVDMGVLLLAKPASVPPRVIANDCILKESLRDGANVTIVGYGATDIWGTVHTTKLHEGFTQINDHDCSDLWSGCNAAVSPGGELSAGGAGIDACFGDSGGPLYLQTERGDFLVGTTSRSYATAYAPCEEGGIYGRPDYIVDWIESVTGRALPRPDCDGEDEPEESDETDYNFPPDPQAESIVVTLGETGETTIRPNDPDDEDTHTFTIIEAPEAGSVMIANTGVVRYIPGEQAGLFQVVVTVSDSGTPTLEDEVLVDVEVLQREDDDSEDVPEVPAGCACSASPPLLLWGWWLLPIWFTFKRRNLGA